MKINAIVLAGGCGKRLWPVSRTMYPKQFSYLTSSKYNLFQETLLRLKKYDEFIDCYYIITNKLYEKLVTSNISGLNILNKSKIFFEPFDKNTLSAITFVLSYNEKIGNNNLNLILPSDHYISDFSEFWNYIERYNENSIVCFGIKQNTLDNSYGYVEAETNFLFFNNVKGFVEKPSKKRIKQFNTTNLFVNSGIFLGKNNSILNEIKKYDYHTYKVCKDINEKNNNLTFIPEYDYKRLKNKSFDKQILEKTDNKKVSIIKSSYWNDLGTWNSIYDFGEKDDFSNVVKGNSIYLYTTKNSLIFNNSDKSIVTLGLENVTVINTDDSVLVADKNKLKGLKNVVNDLDKNNVDEVKYSSRLYKNWGHFTILKKDKKYKVKHLYINPNGELSLQKHNYRSEHWTIVNGQAHVIVEDQEYILNQNQTIYIPKKHKHKLMNREKENQLEVIEVQTGSYLGEDDIIRYD